MTEITKGHRLTLMKSYWFKSNLNDSNIPEIPARFCDKGHKGPPTACDGIYDFNISEILEGRICHVKSELLRRCIQICDIFGLLIVSTEKSGSITNRSRIAACAIRLFKEQKNRNAQATYHKQHLILNQLNCF